ncbi:MAG: hypothetical protein ABWZ99_04050, partial [Ilumatobacteraceae bacterium]
MTPLRVGRGRVTPKQTISINSLTNITFDAETFDSDGFCTPSSDTITIPTGLGGLYNITASVIYGTPRLGTNDIQIAVSAASACWQR